MWKSVRSKAMWCGAEAPKTQPVLTRTTTNGLARVVRKPLSDAPLPYEPPEALPIRVWFAARRLTRSTPESFPVRFWLAARRLIRDPVGCSIDLRSCIDYFGNDLLRYVPTPTMTLSSTLAILQV